ncbi:oligosaccharyl transferase, archaeosortase A system-associated [Methanospirillum hungatei]|uniref:oligosaccharyl transferase, archaeosortase A system-associated n=1 Tax=Methanospirillum hungatei TaxID=2203 RepID=UPI0026EBA1F9|nr:oligosaccharyl transferase, archaeosortase A system-associated [Methanospirillum hungatei]MCA1914829.1 oligosaccharyl transferase, archaeosortase A system-associated [Methanospirillum hungatei]
MTRLKDWLNTHSSHLLILLVIASALLGLWLRFLPMEFLGDGPVQKLIFMDTWYSMRQIEQISENYPGYAWFDPMTAFPTGKDIDWGLLFPFLCASVYVLVGALARPENMIVASYVPPLLFLLLIPIIWYLGKLSGDEKTGWIAAILLPVTSGELLYRSFYGYLDHHITETLFSTLFITLIVALLLTTRAIQKPWYTKKSILLAIFAGIVYFLGLMNIQTMVLFAAICALIFLIHALVLQDQNHLFNLLLHSCLFFITFTVLYLPLGLTHDGFSLSRYSIGHILVVLAVPLELGLLTLFAHLLAKKPRYYYIGMVLTSFAAGYAFIATLIPDIAAQITNSIHYFFFFSYAESYINEMQMWEPVRAWYSYNIAMVLALAGIVICIIRLIRSYQPAFMAILVWGIVLMYATLMHVRYEYYVSIVIVLFSAIGLSSLFSKIAASEQPEKRSKKNLEMKDQNLPIHAIAVVGILMLIIVGFSTQTVMTVADKQIGLISMTDDWAESLTWLSQNSPDPGVNYYTMYEKTEFSYPKEAYGILSWWDYGHWITFLSQRIPITSPFQDNVPPVAQFLAAQSEEDAELCATGVGAKYIITDFATVTSKFAALPLWGYGRDRIAQYQETYYQQSGQAGRYDPVLVLKQPYFESTAVKLHLSDGSYTQGQGGSLLTIEQSPMSGGSFPLIRNAVQISAEDAQKIPKSDNRIIGSIQFTRPITDVPALGHYRLIYESPTTVAADETHQIKEVKIFERVKGYTLPGTGTIELPITTNQGRNFTWQQKSLNGTFTLPYSTQNNPYEVRATGPYRIIETGKTIEVSEDQIT